MNSMEWVYSEKVKDHFMNPRNILEDEKSFSEDGRGLVGNIKCGDQMLVLIRVDPESQKIIDCRWKTYGCASAIASTSVLSEMVIGMTLQEAFAVTPRQIMKQLGDLPEHKVHCSVLGDKALRAAINDYFRRVGRDDMVREEKARIVCQCMSVTDLEIENAVLEGVRNFYELQEHTKIATVCGQCRDDALNVLKEAVRRHFPES